MHVGAWVVGNHNVGGCERGWKGRCAAESCALTGRMGYYGDSCGNPPNVFGAMCPGDSDPPLILPRDFGHGVKRLAQITSVFDVR